MQLKDYIKMYYGGNQRRFAIACGVTPQHVSKMLRCDFAVFNGVLYSKRRDLPEPKKETRE